MKLKIRSFSYSLIVLFYAILFLTGCSEDFLDPKPLSVYTASNTFTSASGFDAVIANCLSLIRGEYYGDAAPIITESIFSEIAIEGTTDKSGPAQNLNLLITPDAQLNHGDYNKIGWYWINNYKVVQHSNIIISRVKDVTFLTDEEKNEILGKAYFLRAFAYYRLTNQFGDVPLLLSETREPKLNYYSTTREVILRKMKKDLELAENWVPASGDRGEITKGAISHLLIKVNLALCEFDDAIEVANNLINNGMYHLMSTRFGSDKGDTNKNVIWDLHRPENKALSDNLEGILLVIDRLNVEGSTTGTSIMRNAVPQWWNRINTPEGHKGTTDDNFADINLVGIHGRGIGRCRATPYSTKYIWEDTIDYRHAPGNWMDMEDLVYNEPNLKGVDSYYGKHLQLYNTEGVILCTDTIRCWFSWPYYKLYIPEPTSLKPGGGNSDWYIFRLAETYLLRAEAYFWKDDLVSAAADINAVRIRSNARPINANEVNIGMIMDERARELYYEEPRKTELTRVSFILAKTGIPSETGKIYSLDNFSEDNYLYDRATRLGGFYNTGTLTIHGDEYTMSPYHVLWPIPAGAINANTKGVINQNKGYTGYENNVPPLTSIFDEGE